MGLLLKDLPSLRANLSKPLGKLICVEDKGFIVPVKAALPDESGKFFDGEAMHDPHCPHLALPLIMDSSDNNVSCTTLPCKTVQLLFGAQLRIINQVWTIKTIRLLIACNFPALIRPRLAWSSHSGSNYFPCQQASFCMGVYQNYPSYPPSYLS